MEGDYEQAMKECNAAIEGDDFEGKYNVYLQRGTMLALAKDFEGALADYNQYLQYDSQDGKAFRWRGIAYFELGKYDAAMKDIQEALNLDANDEIAYMYRYRIHKLRGNTRGGNTGQSSSEKFGCADVVLMCSGVYVDNCIQVFELVTVFRWLC